MIQVTDTIALEDDEIQPAFQGPAHRDVVGHHSRVELLKEPEPHLREGGRVLDIPRCQLDGLRAGRGIRLGLFHQGLGRRFQRHDQVALATDQFLAQVSGQHSLGSADLELSGFDPELDLELLEASQKIRCFQRVNSSTSVGSSVASTWRIEAAA